MTRTSKCSSFYLKATDLEMLVWLADYRLLQPRHFETLAGRHVVAIRRRLRQFVDQRLTDRLTLPYSRSRPVAAPADQYVYRLARRGAQLLRERCGISAIYSGDRQVAFLEHDLTIANFHVTLSLACAEAGLELQWRQTELLDSAPGERSSLVSVNPDALFSVTDMSLPAESNTNAFFLEVERVRQHSYKEGESAFVRKMRAYDRYAVSGACRQTWGFDGFRVLVLVPTAQRAANLRAKLIAADLAADRFWFTDWTRYRLDRPASVLEPIWISAADDRLHAFVNKEATRQYERPSFTNTTRDNRDPAERRER
jgi:hypothetical protein